VRLGAAATAVVRHGCCRIGTASYQIWMET
jgi:hypothetical protein